MTDPKTVTVQERLRAVITDAERHEYDDSNAIWLSDDGEPLLTIADLREVLTQLNGGRNV